MWHPAVKFMACALSTGLLMAAAGAPARAAVSEGLVRYSGVASELGSRRFLYGEQHVVHYEAGRAVERVVLYTCADGAPFARKQVRYADPLAPDFDLVDVRRGHREGLRTDAAGRRIFYQENSRAAQAAAPAPARSGWVADAGFDEFVRAQWTSLLRGTEMPLDFLIPSRLDLHEFQVRRLRAQALAGVPAQVFRLRLSGLLGLLVPSIDVFYSDDGRALLRYEGLSNLQDDAGNHYKVRIDFPPAQRGATDAAALSSAKSEALRPCA